MQQGNIGLQVLLALLKHPLAEIEEIKCMFILDLPLHQPLLEIGEILPNLPASKYAIDHVAAEKSHFYFVTSVCIDFLVLMDSLEDM